VQTPDGRSIIEQDAFFWRALEIIAQSLNAMIANERWLAQQGNK
jgi:hypothetical protein